MRAATLAARRDQVADQAQELAAYCPAVTVGEWSGARPPDVGEHPTRREFFELQVITYNQQATLLLT